MKTFQETYQLWFVVGFIFLIIPKINAQQDPQFTQYMYNTVSVNPAYAGSRGVLSAFGLHRNQWVGMDDAPMTNQLSVHAPLNDTKIGLGVSIINDRIGPINESIASIDFSYSLQLTENYQLSMGLKASMQLFDLNQNQLNPQQTNDPLLHSINNDFSANLGAGLYLHSDKAYIGLSTPMFFKRTRFSDGDDSVALREESLTYHIIGGYVFDIGPSVKFKPALMSKIEAGAPLQIDLSANAMFFDEFVLGAAYRWDAAFSVLAGWQISDRFFAGYAYDIETTELRKYNSGSHEIFLRFELFDREGKVVSPRFF
ncbi:MAG: PorP/SprF family type IX secretion system membrane protein [Bacteroidota bacterium]